MTKKHYFILKNIDPTEIDAKYSFYVQDKISCLSSPAAAENDVACDKMTKIDTNHRTKITDLSHKAREQNTFSYLDESKKEHVCLLTMIDNHDHMSLSEKSNIHCFWCRHPFSYRPIGCPIQYVPDRIVKNYYSEITKDNYTLRENISKTQLTENTTFYESSRMIMFERSFYITDGVFCSFNCCLAFIHVNHTNPLYYFSENLLSQIYIEIFGDLTQPIVPAPSWRLLKSYGGSMSIDEYRKNFYKVEFVDIDNIIMPVVRSRSIGHLFEKQVHI
jgi:hypothetical protein